MKNRYFWISAFLFAALGLSVPCIFPPADEPFPQFGENDFIEYWTAYQLYRGNRDFTDPALVMEAERKEGWKESLPLLMWNPPWTLAILSPVTSRDFRGSARAFIGLNAALLLFSIILVLDALDVPPKNWLLCIMAGVCSLPVIFTFLLGQISIVLAFAVSGIFWALVKKSDYLLGSFLFLASVKPHVVYLLVILIAVGLPFRRLLRAGTACALAAGAVFCLQFWQSPASFAFWLGRARHANHPLLVDVYRWKTTSIATMLRNVWLEFTGSYPVWPVFAVPLLTGIAIASWAWPRRNDIDWRFAVPAIVPLSCATAAFSWIFDASCCVLTQTALSAYALEPRHSWKTRWVLFVLPIILQLILLLHIITFHSNYESYWYFTPALFLIWVFIRRRIV